MREATALSITLRQRRRASTVSGNGIGVGGVRAGSIARTIAILALEVAGCLGKTKRGTVIGILAVLLVVVAMDLVPITCYTYIKRRGKKADVRGPPG